MKYRYLLVLLLALPMGCAHGVRSEGEEAGETTSAQIPMKDLRLAHVRLNPQGEAPAQGTMNFEQMPNSMIVTFHVQGLKPKSTYNLVLHEKQDCGSLDPQTSDSLTQVRTDKMGVAEGSFRSERVLAGQKGVVGDVIVLRSIPKSPVLEPEEIACGKVEPRASSVSL